MSVVKARYSVIAPQAEYLSDPVILAQAWKKSHEYIRRHNWYADTLALDCSAVDLESHLNAWSEELRQESYRPTPMRLVPAPKSQSWAFSRDFSDGWGPDRQEPVSVRPLAHLGIREQTVATAVMLCLADCIETAQGDPGEAFNSDRGFGVFSYGNRLNCLWKSSSAGETARFSWGNSETYSRYSRDYRVFIERPVNVARAAAQVNPTEIFLLKFDLAAFYDNINIERLIEILRFEYARYRGRFLFVPPADEGFWQLARHALTFCWDERDAALSALLRNGRLPAGLPQGMVSSGFFANAYMLTFDRAIANLIKRETFLAEGMEFELLDYARYVDDLRLVVRAKAKVGMANQVASAIAAWIRTQLAETHLDPHAKIPDLDLNDRKTGVEAYSEVGGESRVGARMQSLQHDLSGPFDLATLQHVQAGLEGLLALAELSTQSSAPESQAGMRSPLEDVGKPTLDVRDDTLTRFTALRLTRTLRQQISMSDLSGTENGGISRKALIHDAEVLSRRLIAAWAQDPSLSIVLRYAFDLFPSPSNLRPVLEALCEKLSRPNPDGERSVALYLFAEVFKAAATETGKKKSDRAAGLGDLNAYHACLLDFGRRVLELQHIPWYVQQQIGLFFSTVGAEAPAISGDTELKGHRVLQDFVLGRAIGDELRLEDELAVVLVGYQLSRSREKFARWARDLPKRRSRAECRRAFELIGQFDLTLLRLIMERSRNERVVGRVPSYLSKGTSSRAAAAEDLPNKQWIVLADVIQTPSRLFDQENALLQLALVLAQLFVGRSLTAEKLTPLTVFVKSDNWSAINDPRSRNLKVQIRPGSSVDPRYETPSWCDESLAWMYAIGRLLRAAATGELDFTARQWLVTDEVGHYRGIRSSWQKRRSGMMHTANAMATSMSAITPWMTELLIRLLQWPGAQFESVLIQEWDSIIRPDQLLRRLDERLQAQAQLFGVGSRLPVYRYPVEFPFHKSGALRIVIVQGLCPTGSEAKAWFENSGRGQFRTRHRRHIAALRNLVHRQLSAHESVNPRGQKSRADIILFPEFAVHSDDQDLLCQLSDATGAMLFFGLLNAEHPYLPHKPVNIARWLIPQRHRGRRTWIRVDQGKRNLTEDEKKLGLTAWRPYQVLIELRSPQSPAFTIAGAICYDATDLSLLADLRDKSHLFVVPALNQDVRTFDNMIGALNYHMYQHVIVANTGEFGGSSAQAPYANEHKRLISHVHGSNQIAISIFDIDCSHFGPYLKAFEIDQSVHAGGKTGATIGKTRPAGFGRG